jgi:glutamate-1-semialdehyde 2,1-aminomutase
VRSQSAPITPFRVAHTYAKGDDQFPVNAPPFLVRGSGCHVWDLDGNEFIE